MEVIFDSTSGGVFSALADIMYRNKGYVGGAVFKEDFSVFHYISADKKDLSNIRGCKYNQSNLEGFYTQVHSLLLKGEKVYPCYFPTNRNIKNLIKNTFVALRVLRKEKPDLVISSGAAVAVPFFYIAKLMGKKLIYIEVFDRIDKPTLTGKLVYPIVDKFIVQWDEMKKVYPKAINLGSIF